MHGIVTLPTIPIRRWIVILNKSSNLKFPNVTTMIVDPEERSCLYKEVMNRPEFYNRNRDGDGLPMNEDYLFHYTQYDVIALRLKFYIDKYSGPEWADDPMAPTLVGILEEYYEEVEAQYQISASEYYDWWNFTKPRLEMEENYTAVANHEE